jgi:hypothetical protein
VSNRKAPDGAIFVCPACGKTSYWQYGFDEKGIADPKRSSGWDESCSMWGTLCSEASLVRTPGGRVTAATAWVAVGHIEVTARFA